MSASAAPAIPSLILANPGNRKSAIRQLVEIAILRAYSRQGPGYYYSAGLNRRGTHARELFGHFNHMEYANFISKMNPPAIRRPLDAKSLQKKTCSARSIATPDMLMCGTGQGRIADKDHTRTLADHIGEEVVVKPDIATGGGNGILFMTIGKDAAGGIHLKDDAGRTFDPVALDQHMGRAWLMERSIENQHPWYAALSPRAINSWRIWVIRRGQDTEPQVILAYIRMAQGMTRVDNQGAGGLVVPLLENGRLGRLTNGYPGDAGYDVHPDSGECVEGSAPPQVGAVFDFAGEVLKAFDGLGFAGLDIAMTTDGPVLIEANFGPDRVGAAWCRVPMKCWLAEHGYAR